MNYEHEIFLLLREAGVKGMPVRRIALNVFNMKNSLFAPLSLDTIYEEVATWLRTVSQQSGSPIIRASRRGYYRLNPSSPQVQQMMIEFHSSEEDDWML
ncbi:MAG: hypothetical protein IKO28_02375 [Prevotella sp.]|nr:hypothetical protein [Prevotella sp.]